MGLINDWTDLKVNYQDAQWTGNRRFVEIDNGDGTKSFKDMTNYINTDEDSTFFGASDANQMNKAMNQIANSVIDLEGDIADKIEADMINKFYPVGSIYMSINSTDPQSLFGGTWVRIRDTFLLAAGNTYPAGGSGGSPNSVLIEHYHKFGKRTENNIACQVWGVTNGGSTAIGYNKMAPKANETVSSRYIPATAVTSSKDYRWLSDTLPAGVKNEDGTGRNMPPYLTVYMWKRTA